MNQFKQLKNFYLYDIQLSPIYCIMLKYHLRSSYIWRKLQEVFTMNKITCICLGVRSMEKAIKFYRDGLGYKTDCKEDMLNRVNNRKGCHI